MKKYPLILQQGEMWEKERLIILALFIALVKCDSCRPSSKFLQALSQESDYETRFCNGRCVVMRSSSSGVGQISCLTKKGKKCIHYDNKIICPEVKSCVT